HVNFLENKPNITGSGPTWLFDIDSLTMTMNYHPVTAGNQTNPVQNNDEDVTFDGKEHDFDAKKPNSEVILSPSSSAQLRKQDNKTKKEAKEKSHVESFTEYRDLKADFNNLETSITVSPIPTTKIHKDHPVSQIIGDLSLTTQTRSMTRLVKDQELLPFKMQKVWVLVDLPYGNRATGTKCVFRNKKDERGIVVRNKARLVTQGHTQEEGINYEEVFAPVGRIEAIRLFLAYASFMGFMVYQMDVKSAFKYGTIEEEVYAPRALYEALANYLLENGFQRGKIDQTLFIKKQKGDILVDYDTNIQYHPRNANVVADALSRKSETLANLQIEPEIIRDLERMDIELCICGTKVYWASLKIKPNLILRIKEAQKEDEYLYLVGFAYNNSWHASIKAAPYELLYGQKGREPICWNEVGERVIEGPEFIEVTNENVTVAKEKLKEARSRQKSYTDRHRRELAFNLEDYVFLKVSSRRGVRRFGIKGKLSPRFIGPFKILDRVDQIREDLSLVEEPEISLDRQERVMRNKTILFVKILWKNHPEREATREIEESMRASYPRFLRDLVRFA
nr:putative nucleotidyltransferase, ribonuclease H [Tanacetum cinerariifolium]